MRTGTVRMVLYAWKVYSLRKSSLRRTLNLAKDLNQLQIKRRLFTRLKNVTRVERDGQETARVQIVTGMMKRLIDRWKVCANRHKTKQKQQELAVRINRIGLYAKAVSVWKAVVDRNIRLKRLAVGSSQVSGLSATLTDHSTYLKRHFAAIMLENKRKLKGLEDTLTFALPTQRSFSHKVQPAELAHKQYLAMQQRFSPVKELPPAPAPDLFLPSTPSHPSISQYREATFLLHSDPPTSKPNKKLIFTRWKWLTTRINAEKQLEFEHYQRICRNWLQIAAKNARNVNRIMQEVEIFADFYLKKRIIRFWKNVISEKYAEINFQIARKSKKRIFRRIKQYSKSKKASNLQLSKAFSHYAHFLLSKTLYSLCKFQRFKRLSSLFRLKSLLKTGFFAWRRKFTAHRTFQTLQIRPIFAPKEQTALWIWWENCFNDKFRNRAPIIKSLSLKYHKKTVFVVKNWKNFTKKSINLRKLVEILAKIGYKSGLNTLESYFLEVNELEKTSKIAFRSVKLKLCFRLWKFLVSLQIRKGKFMQKRLFFAWKFALKQHFSRFSSYRRSILLRKYWKKLSNLLFLRGKKQAAVIWRTTNQLFHSQKSKKFCLIQLLRNVFTRKALKKLNSRAFKYYKKVTKRHLFSNWKLFHFRVKWKSSRLELANSFTEERMKNARFGLNEGKLVARSVFTAWKIRLHRRKTLDIVVSGRNKRRNRKIAGNVMKEWKKCTKSAIKCEIEELVGLGKEEKREKEGKVEWKWSRGSDAKSEIRGEIEELERTIEETLKETAHHAFRMARYD